MMLSDHLKTILTGNKDPFTDILGQDRAKYALKSALLSGRNIVLFGPPGIGKTTLAKNIAGLLPDMAVNDCGFNCLPGSPVCPKCRQGKAEKTKTVSGKSRFIRVQGSPDLTAEDLLGDIDPIKAMEYGPLSIEAFTPGKIFRANNGILFFDELNRCPEKLQNALLQVLEEKKATIGSYDVDIEANFLFIATMNPKDTNTERLSDVLLDRFDVVYMDYPETDEIEQRIMVMKGKKLIDVPLPMQELIVGFVRNLRENKNLEKAPSVRATLGLYERAQANAVLKGKNEVDFEDVTDAVDSVIAHRMRLKPSVKYIENPKDYLRKEFEKFVDDHFSELSQSGNDSKGGGR